MPAAAASSATSLSRCSDAGAAAETTAGLGFLIGLGAGALLATAWTGLGAAATGASCRPPIKIWMPRVAATPARNPSSAQPKAPAAAAAFSRHGLPLTRDPAHAPRHSRTGPTSTCTKFDSG